MKSLQWIALLLCALFSQSQAEDAPFLEPHLEPLRPFLGQTWRGQFADSKPDQPVVDIARWERALNGQAVRILHSINNGMYGGESLVVWDSKNQRLSYYYFPTAGFLTQGTMRVENGKIFTREEVTGNKEGVTEVRGTTEIRTNGTFHVKSEYYKKGQWVPGHEATYEPAPGSQVIFK